MSLNSNSNSHAHNGSLAVVDLFNVDGLVAVVTGGATGTGISMAKALEESGAKVYVVGRRSDVLEKAKKEAKHGNIFPIARDITSKGDLERVAAQIQKDVGYINLLVANAGVTGPTPSKNVAMNGSKPSTKQSKLSDLQRELWHVDTEDFARASDVNVSGMYFTIVAFLGLLDAGNKKGNVGQSSQVIITNSTGGFHYAWSASKAACVHMAKQFASTFGSLGIRFNVIAPGLYPSDTASETSGSTEQLSKQEKAAKVAPLGKSGKPEDMAGGVLWLASKAGTWLDGTVITGGGKSGGLSSAY